MPAPRTEKSGTMHEWGTAVMSVSESEIRAQIAALADPAYRDFLRGLLPTVPPETILGVRTPALRGLARALSREPGIETYLACLPHRSFEENNLHAFLIERLPDFGQAAAAVDAFLPYVDNWATCDQLSPRLFRKHLPELLPHIRRWLASGQTYTVRFGIGMLMRYYLGEAFVPEYLAWTAAVPTGEYYLHMMVAWYFATALAKQWDAALPYLTQHRLDRRTHNKAIQKAIESCRIPPEHKALLRTLRMK
jgi:3-methyladenine DNA glycosylase AlkD